MGFAADVRYSLRSFSTSPAVASAVVLTLAIGVGSNAAVFGFIRGVFFPTVPFADPQRVVALFPADPPGQVGLWSYTDYAALRSRAARLEAVAAARQYRAAVKIGDLTVWRSVADVTPQFFEVLRLAAAAGALPTAQDAGASGQPSAVISTLAWHEDYGARADVVGSVIEIDGRQRRITGVAPADFDGLYLGRAVDVWTLLDESSFGATDPRAHLLTVIGRLRGEISIQNARVDGVEVAPYSPVDPSARGRVASISILLVSAAALVLAIACANVVGLLLSLASSRTHQLAVRVALGANRRQLTRQLLADAVVLAVGGGALGWLLASWTSHVVPALLFAEDAEHLHFLPSVTALLLAAFLGAVVMVVSSLAPMVSVPLANPTTVIRRSDDQVTTADRRVRAALVVVQMALSGLLMTSSGLLLIDVRKALQADLGDRLDAVAVETTQASAGFSYFDAARSAVGRLPDVLGTAWIGTLPAGRPGQSTYRIEQPRAAWRDLLIDTVTFTAEGLPPDRLVPAAGRMFGAQDAPGGCKVAMVDQEGADQLFDGDPVGRSIEDASGHRVDIIGVLRRPRSRRTPARPTLFLYAPQSADLPGVTRSLLYHVPLAEARRPVTMLSNVASGTYFALFGLAPIAGRTFTSDDDGVGCGVAIVNQEASDRYFGGHAIAGGLVDDDGRRLEIVGVMPSGVFKTLAPPPEPMAYQPYTQRYEKRMTIVARTVAATPPVLTAITKTLQAVKGGGPLDRAQSLASYFGRTTLAVERIATMLVGLCGTLALGLALLGVYGVLSDSVARRTREFGLRAALGARAWHIIAPLLALGVRLALVGAAFGTLAAFLLHHWFDPFSRTASPGPESVFVWAAAPVALLAIGVLGSLLPARRAVGVDPLVVMRDR